MIAIPLLIQSYGIFALGYGSARVLRLPFDVAAPAAMIGTSNFFELAVAVAISLYGLGSGAALATVVGVLIEVPVMLSLVSFANRTKGWFPALPTGTNPPPVATSKEATRGTTPDRDTDFAVIKSHSFARMILLGAPVAVDRPAGVRSSVSSLITAGHRGSPDCRSGTHRYVED